MKQITFLKYTNHKATIFSIKFNFILRIHNKALVKEPGNFESHKFEKQVPTPIVYKNKSFFIFVNIEFVSIV